MIFMVHFLAIQRVISAIASLVTCTRAKSKRRLHETTICLTLSRSYFNETCILFEDITKHNFSILDYMASISLPLLAQPWYWLIVNQPHLTQRLI